MGSYRMDRISEDISRELTAILRTVKDPRVGDMVSILRVEVTNDLSYATVHITSLRGMADAQEAVKGLKSAAGYMRRELGHALKLRHVPELRFLADDSIEYSVEIARKLNEIRAKQEESDGDE